MRLCITLLVVLLAGLVAWMRSDKLAPNLAAPAVPKVTPETTDRVAAARTAREGTISERCWAAGLNYPPKELFLRAFKQEAQLEAWGRDQDGPMQLIGTWSIVSSSGKPGPKRKEGDRQVPEGCYQIEVFNPKSSYHLSLGLNYPNDADRKWADARKPGSDIYIHGGFATIGCLPLGDPGIEEVYLLAYDVRQKNKLARLPVHIFPARMEGETWDGLKLAHPEHVEFWSELQPIYEAFEPKHEPLQVRTTDDGHYQLNPAG